MKRLIFFCLLYFLASNFCVKKTDGLTILGISSDRPFQKRWETRQLTHDEEQELKDALSQKFTYFGCGGQCFVFFSEDQKYVLKFFKQQLYEMPLWMRFFPLPWPFHRYYAKKKFRREDKLDRDFSSYKIAFEELKDETEVLYVHLNQTQDLKQIITIVDRLGIEHYLHLDDFNFVIQKKAKLIYSTIDQFMSQGNRAECKQIISQTLRLILMRCKKGFSDRDPNIRTNCGFIGKTAIKIDVGKIMRSDEMKMPEIYKKELTRIAEPFKNWIDENHPSLSKHFEEELSKILEESQ
jgi:hypothetical protein